MSLISGKELITYQNKLFWVYRKVRLGAIKEGYINDVKQFWGCDVVVKSRNVNDETLLFLKEIEDAIIVS